MKRFYEFEVIIPNSFFEFVDCVIIEDFLRNFVSFSMKGCNDHSTEYLITSPSRNVANCVRELLASLQRVVLASSFSAMDKLRCKGWLYGVIREVESD